MRYAIYTALRYEQLSRSLERSWWDFEFSYEKETSNLELICELFVNQPWKEYLFKNFWILKGVSQLWFALWAIVIDFQMIILSNNKIWTFSTSEIFEH